MQQIKYFSTFSGIGGFELGIQQAYESLCDADRGKNRGSQTNKERNKTQRFFSTARQDISSEKRSTGECNNHIFNQRPLCIGFSEIDKYAVQIYQKHFPNHKNYGDITRINAEELPDFELLVGGFPCQAFSIAGKRQGFDDTRGTLFFDLARILRAKQPRLFLFENVKGLLSHDNGKTFATIIATLNELGYDCQWQVLNSKNHGVPQNRERVFIIGNLRGTTRPQVFPFGENAGISNGQNESDQRRSQTEVSHTLRGSNVKADQVFIAHNIHGGFGEGKVREFHNYSPTLRTPAGGGHIPSVVSSFGIRRLTPTECERLQGFPDHWTEGISDTQRYKCCGNAVTVNVIRDIADRLLR